MAEATRWDHPRMIPPLAEDSSRTRAGDHKCTNAKRGGAPRRPTCNGRTHASMHTALACNSSV
eukprot:1980869-Pyramimonas_sp.AAC.1